MKKLCSLVLVCALLASLLCVVSLAEPAAAKGDVNGDSAVNMKDVLAVRRYVVGLSVTLDLAAADLNDDTLINMKDVLFLRRLIVGLLPSAGTTTATVTPTRHVLDLITVITNGSNESDGTAIRDEGEGFVISQKTAWNVWVLYFHEALPDFTVAEGESLFLEFDFTVNGDAHLNINGWNNSIAAAIAATCGADTTPAEDGTPMLIQGTYRGKIPVELAQFGETGRLGIVGSGATIRAFRLVAETGGDTTAHPTTTAPQNEPHLQYDTDTTFGSLGTWWWNSAYIVDETTRAKRLDFLQQNHVTEVYLWVDNQTDAQIAAFIRDAASRGMRVAWLSGDVSWIQDGNTGFDRLLTRFEAYQNAAPNDAKFYGIHLDVEPHQAGSTPENWQRYADLVVHATDAAHKIGTAIEWDIPFWLDRMTVTVDGEETALLTLLADRSDTLTLMSYRDTAAAILDISREELPLGSAHRCKIVLGVETYSTEGAYVSFLEDGKGALYEALQSVLETLSKTDTLDFGYGCAVHYVETWMKLKNE